MQRSQFARGLGILVSVVLIILVILVMVPARAERLSEASRVSRGGHPPSAAEPDVIDAVNALAQTDIGIVAAMHTGCALDRLPASRAALLPLLPGDHRRLIEQCARGRTRMSRRTRDFDLLGMLDEPAERSPAAAAVRAYFSQRSVDVATGTGLSDGAYPISFDWVVVLDPHSRTLMSFVLNCRD